mmetsp:Transcript_20326/g.44235  ORF Transcript_20326/g.44235 Transcript_20326/m.44235 type:complete len:261 (-) Transcript_20326:938-1720(-)
MPPTKSSSTSRPLSAMLMSALLIIISTSSASDSTWNMGSRRTPMGPVMAALLPTVSLSSLLFSTSSSTSPLSSSLVASQVLKRTTERSSSSSSSSSHSSSSSSPSLSFVLENQTSAGLGTACKAFPGNRRTRPGTAGIVTTDEISSVMKLLVLLELLLMLPTFSCPCLLGGKTHVGPRPSVGRVRYRTCPTVGYRKPDPKDDDDDNDADSLLLHSSILLQQRSKNTSSTSAWASRLRCSCRHQYSTTMSFWGAASLLWLS